MKTLFTFLLISFCCRLYAQNQFFDSTNYFDHFYDGGNNPKIKGKKLKISWLNIEDAKKVMIELFEKQKLDSFVENKLFEIDSGKYLFLTFYFPTAEFGILYTQDHIGYPMPTKRKPIFQDEYFRIYSEVEGDKPLGKEKILKLNHIPENIIIVNQNYYWYEDTGNRGDDKYLVTKEVAIRILQEDLKSYFAKVKKRQGQ